MTNSRDARPEGGTVGLQDVIIEATEGGEIDLSDLRWVDSIILAIFWILAFVVFLQFFTRYVLNDSLGWTEEIARYLLIGVTFTGAVMCTRKHSHIAVEFIYRWVPRPVRRVAQALIDLTSTAFFVALTWYTFQVAGRTQQMMVSIEVPKALIYWGVAACFAAMALHAALNGVRHLRTGTSRLIDPDLASHSPVGMD
jgi:TRAP-type C4-dicarboxylate transport system permease small subunit